MAKKKTPAPRASSQADVLRLGPQIAGVKASTNPKAWASFVKTTHAQGRTVGGQLSGAPDSLKERTQSSLKSQAAKSVSEAYAPALADLDSQESRVKAWDVKRAKDNESYNAWLKSTNAQLAAQAASNTATLATQNAEIVKAQTTLAQGAQAHAGDNLIAADTAANAQKNSELVASAGKAANAPLDASNAASLYAAQQPIAQAAARDASRYADTQKQLKGIFDARTKVTIGKASDTLGEYTRLQSQNVANVDSTRNYSAAAEKLQLDSDKLDATVLKNANDYKIKQANVKIDQTNAQTTIDRLNEAIAHNDATESVADRTLGLKGLTAALDAVKVAQKAGGGPEGKKAVTAAEKSLSSKNIQQIDSARTNMGLWLADHPGGNYRKHLQNAGYSASIVALALELRQHGGKLTPAGVKKAKQLGVLNPDHVYG